MKNKVKEVLVPKCDNYNSSKVNNHNNNRTVTIRK